MPGYAYLDASAIVKLAVFEPETPALEHDALNRDGLVSSQIGAVEVRRAARRDGKRRALQQVDDVLEALYLVDLTRLILTRASDLTPRTLRTLDALHLSTALSLELPELDFITYDARLAEAARSAGLNVKQPR